MSFSLIPAHRKASFQAISPEWLQRRGISLVLADLDNTLARYRQEKPGPALLEWRDALKAQGIALFILSNSRKPDRVRVFCAESGIPFLNHAGKPKRAGFQTALRQMGAAPERTLMVGDQIFTDILGGNRAGVDTVLVRPLALDSLPRKLRYGIETPFRLLCRDKEGWK